MMWLEKKYILLLSSQLPLFKQKSDNLFNFRCILCGDSKTHKNKTRGYIYFKSGRYIYHCHNCNASHNFTTVLKQTNSVLYDQYLQEKLSTSTEQPKIEQKFEAREFRGGFPHRPEFGPHNFPMHPKPERVAELYKETWHPHYS